MSNIIVNFPLCEITCTDLKPTTITDTTSSKGTSGQILSSTGTGIDWINPPASTWVGTATSNLDMNSIYDIVKARSLDNNGGGITIGASVNNANGITIGKSSGTGTTTIVGTLDAQTIDRAGTINIGTSSGTSIGISRAGQTTTVNGTLSAGTIDRAGTIDIGTASGTSIAIGRATQTTTVNGTLGAETIDRGGTINIGTTNSTGVTVGRATQTTTVNGTLATATIDRAGTIDLGASNATTITVGKTTGTASTTNIRGLVQFNSSSGTSGQYLKSNGTLGVPTWDTVASSWVGTATSNLNMNNFAITSPNVLEMNGGNGMLLNSAGVSCEILGTSIVGGMTLNANSIGGCSSIDGNNSALTIGQGASTTSTVLGKTLATTNIQGNVQFSSSAGTSGQVLQSNGTGTVPTWVNNYISPTGVASGNIDMNNFAITSPNVLEMNGGNGMLLNSVGDTCEILGTSIVGGMTLNTNSIAGCSSIDGNNSALTIGQGASTTSTVIGRSTATTNIQGNVQFSSSAGTSGQVLQSNGTGTAPTWVNNYISPTGVASGNIDMNNFAITSPNVLEMSGGNGMLLNSVGDTCEILGISNVGGMTMNANTIGGCSSIDGNNSALTIGQGVSTTSTVIGRSTATTNIQGNVQFSSSAGTSGQYLRSNGTGTAPTWVNGTGAWSGTALTDLNMGGFDITGADSIDNNGAINIGSTSATSIGIGRSTIPVTLIGGNVSVEGVNFSSSAISSCSSLNNAPSTAIAIGDTQTTGALNIGTNASRSAGINIANGATSTCNVNILTGASATGDVNISSGTSNSGAVNLLNGGSATGAVNLATGTTSAGVVNLSTGASSTGTVNLGGGTSVVRTNRPITLNYPASQAIASTAFLGGTTPPVYTGTNPNNSTVQIARVVLTRGVWILIGQAIFQTPGAGGFFSLSISSLPTVIQNTCCQSQSTFANNPVATNVSRFVATDVNVTWYLTAQTPVSCPVTNVGFIAYRIA
jgi:hypothetical protein